VTGAEQLLWHQIPRASDSQGFPARHAFCTRRGGSSSGCFASLNLSWRVGDDPVAVAANWQRVRESFPQVRRWVTMEQVHGNAVAVVHEDSPDRLGPCDALITNLPSVALCVLTADCVPILLASHDGAVVAAVHAGWRGTVTRVVEETVRRLTAEYGVLPNHLWAALGPAIGPCCYAVGAEVADAARRTGLDTYCVPLDGTGQCRLDLQAMNRELLLRAGVPESQVCMLRSCTACRSDEFFSHRQSGGRTGRQLSWIAAAGEERVTWRT